MTPVLRKGNWGMEIYHQCVSSKLIVLLSCLRGWHFTSSSGNGTWLQTAVWKMPISRSPSVSLPDSLSGFLWNGIACRFHFPCFGFFTSFHRFTRVFKANMIWVYCKGIKLLWYLDYWLILTFSCRSSSHISLLLQTRRLWEVSSA